MPVPLPAPYDHHHHHGGPGPLMDPAQAQANWVGGRYPCGPVMTPQTPYMEHQKAVTIRNDVNLKKESLRIEPDEENPGRFLVSFTFDATVPGRYIYIYIYIMYKNVLKRVFWTFSFYFVKLNCFGVSCLFCRHNSLLGQFQFFVGTYILFGFGVFDLREI